MQNAAFSIAPLAMTSQLMSSQLTSYVLDFTLPFYRSRVVVAALRRQPHTGWSSGRLGRPLTTGVWVASVTVVLAVGLLIAGAGYFDNVLDSDQQTSVNHSDATLSAVASATSSQHSTRRRRLKNAFRSREFRQS